MDSRTAGLLILTLGGALALSLPLHAADVPPPTVTTASDPDLPQPLDLSAFQPLLKSPPFNRVVDYTDSLLLTGVAYVEGKPMATLMDKATRKNYVVSEVPNAQGWRLAEASIGNELRGTQIKMQVGGETVTFRYSDFQLNPSKVGVNGSKYPTQQQAIGHDENGKPFVRGSVYLSEADRDHYHNGMSKEGHDQFRQIIRDNRDQMMQMTDEQRAQYTKKMFDQVDAQDKSKQVKK